MLKFMAKTKVHDKDKNLNFICYNYPIFVLYDLYFIVSSYLNN